VVPTRKEPLDLEKLCAAMLPGHNIKRIRYFTAKVKASPHDPDAAQRQ
jgi:methylglyoxal synthase